MTEARGLAVMLFRVAEYYGRTLSENGAEVYLEHLGNIDPSELKAALNAHIRDPERGRWMPTVADLLWQAGGDARTEAAQEWERYINRQGASDYAWDIAQTLGGWQRIGFANVRRELPFIRKEFIELYCANRERPERVGRRLAPPEPEKLEAPESERAVVADIAEALAEGMSPAQAAKRAAGLE